MEKSTDATCGRGVGLMVGRRRLMVPVFARSERGGEIFGKSRLRVGALRVASKFKGPSVVVGIAALDAGSGSTPEHEQDALE